MAVTTTQTIATGDSAHSQRLPIPGQPLRYLPGPGWVTGDQALSSLIGDNR